MSTTTQYTVKVPLNPLNFPSSDKVVIWDASEGKFNLASGLNCTKWTYSGATNATGISSGEVRFNNATITSSTEIYIHKDSVDGSNDWGDYFTKLTKYYCCTLTVRVPGNQDEYIVFDYDPEGSLYEGTYLKFSVSNIVAAPLVNDSDFSVSNGDALCLDFDLFKCVEKGEIGGTGDTENYVCNEYYQYNTTSLNPVTSVSDIDINGITLGNGLGQFTIGLSGGTTGSYTLGEGDTVYVYMSQANYWGENVNALGIQVNNQITFNQYNTNGTETTGEQLVLNTSDVLYQYVSDVNNLSLGYIVFQATIESITAGLTSGLSDDSTYCLNVIETPVPPVPTFEECRGVFVHSVFNNQAENNFPTNYVNQLGDTIFAGDDIGNYGGGGILGDGSLCSDQTYTFFFAATDTVGQDQTSFFNSLGPGDILKYELVYDSVNNDAGDFILLQIQNIGNTQDGSSNVFYAISANVLPQSNYNSCEGFFKNPNNIVCLNKQIQSTPSPIPLDGEGYVGYVDSTTISGITVNSGSTAMDSTDITQVTELVFAGLDANNNSWVDEFSANTMYSVNIHYKTSTIEYEVTGTQYSSAGIGKLQIQLGRILKNGFNSKTATEKNAKTLEQRQAINYFFNFETIPNQQDGRVITSTGSGDGLEAQQNLTFKNNNLTIIGNVYQQSVETDITTNGDHNIMSIPTSSGSTFEFTYFVQEDTTGGYRAGKVLAAVDDRGSTTVFTDTSTQDGISTTQDIEFSTVISGNNLLLRATTTNGTTWNVKTKVEILF